jgi:hypothetical protein
METPMVLKVKKYSIKYVYFNPFWMMSTSKLPIDALKKSI